MPRLDISRYYVSATEIGYKVVDRCECKQTTHTFTSEQLASKMADRLNAKIAQGETINFDDFVWE